MTPAIPISVVILTRNEADNIVRCITSVRWCDDILLVDNSDDETVRLAQKTARPGTLRVVKENETANFAYLRNQALTKAKQEWVLFLDADEEVTEKLQQEIARAIDSNEMNGYRLRRKDYFLGTWLKYGETGNITLLKLGRRSKGKWRRNVHEVWELAGPIGELTEPLLHYPHPTIAEFISRINRWTTLDAQVFYEQEVRSSWWKVIAYPVGKFVRNYFVKQGYRDGMPGLIMAVCMSFHSFLTRAKLYLLQTQSMSS